MNTAIPPVKSLQNPLRTATIDENIDYSNEKHLELFSRLLRNTRNDKFSKKIPEWKRKFKRQRSSSLFNSNGEFSDNESLKDSVFQEPETAIASLSVTYAFLWFPLLVLVLGIILIELMAYIAVRQIVNFWEYFYTWYHCFKDLHDKERNQVDSEEQTAHCNELQRVAGGRNRT
jgi:hypothetical protein